MSWTIQTTQPSDRLVVEPAEVRKRLVLGAEDDSEIGQVIRAATAWVENYTSLRILTQTVVLHLDCFPVSKSLMLNVYPVSSIVSVAYDDTDDVEQSFGDYVARLGRKPSLIYSDSWPTTSNIPGAVRIEMVAGADDADDVEPDIIQAVLLIAGHWFENKEGYTDIQIYEVPMGVKALLANHRLHA